MTELEIPKEMAQSYSDDYYDIKQYDAFKIMNQQHIEDLAMALLQRFLSESKSIREIAKVFDKETHMFFESGRFRIRH